MNLLYWYDYSNRLVHTAN